MITQADITTGAYFFMAAGAIITSIGGIIIYLHFKSKYPNKKP